MLFVSERDEREKIVALKAARIVFLIVFCGFLGAGLAGMIRINLFSYTRWQGDRVPPLVKVGPYELRKGKVEKEFFLMWPSLGFPSANAPYPEIVEREHKATQYFYESGSIFKPGVARTFFTLAAVQVLLLHLFSRRIRS
ncbi:MAG: hypothetical protein HY921_08795 [Elusimicrobia bacterium]|nr:hypothetical protein [Elusimicrobiota bacterium]